MQSHTIENYIIISLNHKQLIDNNQLFSNNTKIYEIKKELFAYAARDGVSKLRERKKSKRMVDSIPGTENKALLEEIRSIKNVIEEFLKNKTAGTNLSVSSSQSDPQNVTLIERVMNATYKIPNLKGENMLNEMQTTVIDSQTFLIPPQCKFYNQDVRDFEKFIPNTEKFDFIVMDPPWWNKYIRRVKTAKKELSYDMLYNDTIANIPINNITHENSIVVIWCTNASSHIKEIVENFLPKWNLKLLSKWIWVKVNVNGKPVCDFKKPGQKQPFEQLFIACRQENSSPKFLSLSKQRILVSVPSVIHSHKPPLYEIFRHYLPDNPACLEIFARYLHPKFTSIGLEVLKLQDIQLYNIQE